MPDFTRKEIQQLIAVATQPLNLRGADLQGIDLTGLDLQGANLQGANLQDADLSGVKGYKQ